VSPFVPALLLVSSCALSACQGTKERERPAAAGQEDGVKRPRPGTSEGPAPLERATDAPPAVQVASAEKSAISPAKRRYVVAALGDSITDSRSGGGGYLKVLEERCPLSEFLNFGKGGDMTNQMRRRFETEIAPQIASQKIDTLLVYGGVNDLYSDLTALRKNDVIEEDLTQIYQLARSRGLTVVAVTVSPWGGFSKYWNPRRGQNTQLLNSWILGQVATGLVDKAVDSFTVLSCGDPQVLCADYETPFHDGIHPGKQGHAILGAKLADEAFNDCL
jgi:lysophospholipase L1-like esterase